MGRRGGIKRAENIKKRAAVSNDDQAREMFQDASPELAEELLRAARGEGIYEDLSSKVRMDLVVRALEWALGRPAAVRPEKSEEKPEVGLTLE